MIRNFLFDFDNSTMFFFPSVSSQGVQHLTKGCELNNANACFYLSGMHISGVQSSAPPVAATTQPDVGRKSSSGSKAVPASARTIVPSADGVIVKDMQKAFTFAYKACELRNMYACANLSQMYSRGEGTEKSEEKAEKFKKMALDMQDEVKNNKSIGISANALNVPPIH